MEPARWGGRSRSFTCLAWSGCRLCGTLPDPISGQAGSSWLSVSAASFEQASRLRGLVRSDNEGLKMLPNCFDPLTALSTLAWVGCDLERVPPALTALAASLCRLHLDFGSLGRLDSNCADTILYLPCLLAVGVSHSRDKCSRRSQRTPS